MEYRELGRTGMKVSAISFGAWAIGGTWGPVEDEESVAALHRAIDLGVNFIDTADVYGDGRSERLIAQVLKERSETVYVATKAGRRLKPHTADGYSYDNLAGFVGRSLKNLQTDALDLMQLHCPPTDVYRQDVAFDALDRLTQDGLIKHYGVSVETVEEAVLALAHPNVKSVQLIFNMFRFKPSDSFFSLAKEKNAGIIVRVPLASGLLSGKMTRQREFDQGDHRAFNRHGESFDQGETFSGVDFEMGLEAAEELKHIVPEGHTLAQLALRWILMHPAVSCAIPGAKRPAQVEDNVAAADLAALTPDQMQQVKQVYDGHIREQVHHRW